MKRLNLSQSFLHWNKLLHKSGTKTRKENFYWCLKSQKMRKIGPKSKELQKKFSNWTIRYETIRRQFTPRNHELMFSISWSKDCSLLVESLWFLSFQVTQKKGLIRWVPNIMFFLIVHMLGLRKSKWMYQLTYEIVFWTLTLMLKGWEMILYRYHHYMIFAIFHV